MNSISDYPEAACASAKGSHSQGRGVGTKSIRNKFCARLALHAAALSILLCPASEVFGDAYYNARGNYNPTSATDPGYYASSGTSDAQVSFSRPVGDVLTIGSAKSYSTSSGYADAGNLKLGASSWAVSKPGNAYFTDAYITTEASNRFQILPGTSSLQFGDTTTLTLNFRLDGSLITDARSYPGSSWAYSEMRAGLSIVDRAIVIPAEGESEAYSPTVATFGASSSLTATHVDARYWPYSYYNEGSESWSVESNLVARTSHGADFGRHTASGENMYYTGVGTSFDTGLVSLSFQAIVGHTLDIEAFLFSRAEASHEAEAWTTFDNTLAFGVTPTVAGAQLEWAVPGDAKSVPDSGGAMLALFALLSVFGLHRICGLRRG